MKKSTDEKKKVERFWTITYPSLIVIFAFAVFIILMLSGYKQLYLSEIKNNIVSKQITEKLIAKSYNVTSKVVEENGERKVITVLEKKPEINKKQKPKEIEAKAIYLTAYGVTSSTIYNRAKRLLKETELNAVIIDIKDYSGQLSYKSSVPLVKELGADAVPKIKDMKKIIDELHELNVYVIARQTVFQDPIISKQKPDWAVQDKFKKSRWVDRKGIGWADPSVKQVWDYNIDIAKEAVALGFDEINLDYIRFPTDGKLKAMVFNNHPDNKPKHETIKEFIKYFSEKMKDEPAYISVDLFGLVTVKVKQQDDLGIGQLLVDFIPYVDYISPMVYPSHYANNFIGLKNPATNPYEVVKYSMDKAKMAFDKEYLGEDEARAKLRPWLQDFDMGAVYNASMVKKQIQASDDADTFGWLLWDPRNMYTEGALIKNPKL